MREQIIAGFAWVAVFAIYIGGMLWLLLRNPRRKK